MVQKKVVAAFAALGLAATSVAAQADVAASAPVTGENELGSESGGLIALLAVVAVVLIGAFTLIDDDDPVSP